jgi:cyclopropane fatty-acyl-phospholipid synthase-like methyltransferase
MGTHQPHSHHHGHVRLDEGDWEAFAAHAEREGELLLAFVTDAAREIAEVRSGAPSVRRVLDIGSGPGVGTCELARLFPDAQVVAVDGSPAMLDRATRRAAAHGLERRVCTRLAEVPDGLDELGPVDVIWASMSLHHVGDETNALRVLRDLLEPSGLLAVAEVAEAMRFLPDDLALGRPGLVERLDRAESNWFAAMRADLSGSVPSADLASMLTAAGYEVIASRIARVRVDPPLSDALRQFAAERIRRARQRFDDALSDDDLRALDVLIDGDDPRGIMHRDDVFIAASRRIVIARPV